MQDEKKTIVGGWGGKPGKKGHLRNNGSPSDQPPVLLDTTAESNLLANVGASWGGEDKLRSVVLVSRNLGTGGCGTNVDHDDFVLGKLRNLGLLAIGCANTEETAEEVEVDFDFAVDLGKTAFQAQDVADEAIGSAESGIDAGADTNQTTGDGILEIVGLRVQGDDATEDGLALKCALVVTSDNTGSDLDLVTQLQHTVENTATGDTTLKLVNLGTRLVDVKRSNDNHVRIQREVSWGNGDGIDNGIEDGINVELELSRDGNDGRLASYGTPDELEDRLVVLLSSLLPHEINLVLENDDLVQLHNFDSCQVLRGLGLRARFVSGDKEKGGVHDGCTRQHGTHQNIVTRAVDESASLS